MSVAPTSPWAFAKDVAKLCSEKDIAVLKKASSEKSCGVYEKCHELLREFGAVRKFVATGRYKGESVEPWEHPAVEDRFAHQISEFVSKKERRRAGRLKKRARASH